MKARWIGEGDGTKLVGRNKAETKKGKGQQRQGQKNETRIISQKGLMNIKSKVEMEDRRERPEKMTNWEWFWKKDLGWGGGGKRAKHLSNCQKPFVCISYKSTPLEKTPELQGKRFFYHNIKAKQQTQTKKRKITKKNKNKEHNNNPDTNNRETRSPQMQETWVWKGDAMELALKESNKLKKGRKKKEDRTESKRKQNVRSKGFDELPRCSRTAARNNDYSSVVLQF